MRAGIALGSNIEPRLLYLQAARRELLNLHVGSDPVIGSRVYETAPVDCSAEAEPFLNAALEISTSLSPMELLTRLLEIETDLGRPNNHPRNSPRTIDLDLLYCDGMTLEDSRLILPHPRISERAFVLLPLADIRPRMLLPGQNRSIAQLLTDVDKTECRIYSESIY
ncbi:2-amino-4-hydroxy-6-hydroxymethyldihydropteridine diphosphokinase [Terrimicrobium sacchariphilum]|uniref:2-amino-4-hydroxy-6-hydroxymethyldihydropteridine pyrophosphokinase n=1 Tax=Terrimicrobium sacchariphilum TaxID=690879 RepID=A0A146G9N0_TERSA|nr:2-amino-4-hydroxy-6-hydroxymethyldihydropteridine diphosphokinase [Terrimicrobium sacchariphilum]GAT33983.1 2-amino-4-hydroxy-6-hydroxymethyldihydropteridine diphosphokinase [Terrimicrobium sacchariphilum]